MYVATSLPADLAPPIKKGVVRMRVFVGGYYISPRPGGCDGGTPVPWEGAGRESGRAGGGEVAGDGSDGGGGGSDGDDGGEGGDGRGGGKGAKVCAPVHNVQAVTRGRDEGERGGGGGKGYSGREDAAPASVSVADPYSPPDPDLTTDAPATASVMVTTLLHIDLGHGVPRTIYRLVGRRFAHVMESFRRFALKP